MGKRAITLEDGFLVRHFPVPQKGVPAEPSASYLLDDTGVHYDASVATQLERTIASPLPRHLLEPSTQAIAELATSGISKFNASPDIAPSSLGITGPYVLLIDQVPGDLSIVYGGASPADFSDMLEAALDEHPGMQVVIRSHPAYAGRGTLARAADAMKGETRVVIVSSTCALWPLLREARHVYTVSSHAGFEALLAGVPVTCFGLPFYAGWGLTDDRKVCSRRQARPDLTRLFAAAYIERSRYFDMHDGHETTLADVIDTLDHIRSARRRLSGPVATIGLSLRKRRAVAPFLVTNDGPARHASSLTSRVLKEVETIAVWSDRDIQTALPVVRLEDGFVRSAGLGADFVYPASLTMEETDHLHFDASGDSSLVQLIRKSLSPSQRKRSLELQRRLVADKVTKYMERSATRALPDDDRLRILVVGQVEDDASIRLGATNVSDNTQLLQAVRRSYPNALIAYRDHPDVKAGLRKGRADRSDVDLDVSDHTFLDALDWCDRLETITSLAGFEALLRGKPVGVHGRPFYAGWGLTDDRALVPPRGSATLEQVLHAALIEYPVYIHPLSELPCSVERVIDALKNSQWPGSGRRMVSRALRLASLQ